MLQGLIPTESWGIDQAVLWTLWATSVQCTQQRILPSDAVLAAALCHPQLGQVPSLFMRAKPSMEQLVRQAFKADLPRPAGWSAQPSAMADVEQRGHPTQGPG